MLALAVVFVVTTPFVIHVLSSFAIGLFTRIATMGAA
jgi:flagellar biosynthesis protein FliQ